MKRLLVTLAALGLALAAQAQVVLPGAAPADPGAAAPPQEKPKPRQRRPPPAPVKVTVDPASALGRVLKQNGKAGELQLEKGEDGALKIVKYTLLGEVGAHPLQRCRIDIVADKPTPAVSKGEPDGLARYSADIPACPLTFDIVSDGVLVPPQTNACVFTAADCQASPSGLWGPEAAELDKDPKAVSKARAAADRAIQDSLHKLIARDKDSAAALAREENDFAAERDEVCQNYSGEARLGFCASRLAQARAALLGKRAGEGGPAAPEPHKRHKKKAAPKE